MRVRVQGSGLMWFGVWGSCSLGFTAYENIAMYWDNKRDAPVSQIIGRTSATKLAQPVSPFNPIILSNCILGFLIRVRVSGSFGSGFLMRVRV